LQLDPLSLILNENLGDILILARRYDEAEAQLRKTLELDPDFFVARGTLARLYEIQGRYKEALELDLKGEPPDDVRIVMKIFAESGMKGVWQDDLEAVLERAKKQRVSPNRLAQSYVKLDDKDKAFEWLNKALDARALIFTYLVADARYDNIRSDPRYAALLQRANLKPLPR
jgi:tetratricopeptide (TPR) repeat protein